MRILVAAVVVFCMTLWLPLPGIAAKSSLGEVIQNNDGYLTINQKRISLLRLLELIAQSAGFDIYIVDDIKLSHSVQADFAGKLPEEILQTLLRGRNYAIVYAGFDPTAYTNRIYMGSDMQAVRLGGDGETPPTATGISTQVSEHTDENRPDRHQAASNAERRVNPYQFEVTNDDPEMVLVDNSSRFRRQRTDFFGGGRYHNEFGHSSFDRTDNARDRQFRQSNSNQNGKRRPGSGKSADRGDLPHSTGHPQMGAEADNSHLISEPGTGNLGGIDTEIPSTQEYLETAEFSAASSEEQMLLEKINNLRNRIDSGISDKTYEHWFRIKGHRHVTHDREWLAFYEEKLSKIQD
jgi:hypothetical protein